MSDSLLYHAFGVRGYRYRSTRYEGGEVFIRIEPPRESLRCPACGHSHVHIVERFRRWWRTLPIGARSVWIEMFVPKVQCQSCGARRRVPVRFAALRGFMCAPATSCNSMISDKVAMSPVRLAIASAFRPVPEG